MGACCIAFSAVFVRLADVSPSTAAVFRTAYAIPVLGLLAWIERFRFGPRTWREHRLAAIAGAAFAADLIFWHNSIDAVGAGLATVIGNMQVVVVGVIAWLFLHEHPDRRLFASIPVVVCGVVLVSGVVGTGAYGRDPVLGVVFGIGTAMAYTVFILVHRESARDLRRPAGPLFEATIVTAAVSLAYGLVSRTVSLEPVWPNHGWLLGLAMAAQVVGWLFLSVSLPRLPAALSSVMLLIQPVGSLLLGFVILGEDPSSVQLAGVVLILTGVFVAARGRARVVMEAGRAAAVSPSGGIEESRASAGQDGG